MKKSKRSVVRVDISGLPKHLVLWRLWLYARPDMAVVNEDEPFRSPKDAKRRVQADSELCFAWVDGRELAVCLKGTSFNTKLYDLKNGVSGVEIISALRGDLEFLRVDLGSPYEAIRYLTKEPPTTLVPEVSRAEPKGTAILNSLLEESP